MTRYRQTLNEMYSTLRMFQREGASAYKPDLANIKVLLEHLGNPHDKFKSIHIAGTNGKGSTAHIIASLLQENGLKVGLHTSPHYLDFRERIKINGNPVEKAFVCDFYDSHKELIKEHKPSFFEFSVAMAFSAFAEKKVDLAVVETGLGGRLDATNILQPLLSIITNIDYDHQDILGETLSDIAREKAGIIKKGIPVVLWEKQKDTYPVFKKSASANEAPIFIPDDLISMHVQQNENNGLKFTLEISGKQCAINPDITGSYQLQNIRTALAGYAILSRMNQPIDIRWNCKIIKSGLEHIKVNTAFIGRWQILNKEPIIIADSAHNEQGIKSALAQLEKYEYERLHIVLGFVKDKDWEHIIKLFPHHAQYYCVQPALERGLDVDALHKKMVLEGFKARRFPSVKAGVEAASNDASSYDLIFIGGSTFVTAETLKNKFIA